MGRLARKGKRLRPPSLRSADRGRLFQPATMLRTSTRHLHGCANLEPNVAQVMPILFAGQREEWLGCGDGSVRHATSHASTATTGAPAESETGRAVRTW